MLPPCMLYEKFQVFGIHIYLKDPKELLCTAIPNVKPRHTTENPQYKTPAPPPRTYITALENDKSHNSNSENYAIEAIDTDSSCASIYSEKQKLTSFVISVFICFYLKYVIQR